MAMLPDVGRALAGRALAGRVRLVVRAVGVPASCSVVGVVVRSRSRAGLVVGAVRSARLVVGVRVDGVRAVGVVRRSSVRVGARVGRVLLAGRALSCRMAPAGGAIRGASVGVVRAGLRVRVRARAIWPDVGAPRDCGRSAWALESWADLPGPWASVVVPDVGYVGRSLAALDWLRGAAVEWQEATGRVLVAGRVVIGDDGRPVLVVSSALALGVVVRAAAAIESAIGAAVGLVGSDRGKRMDAVRKGQRGTVAKGARWVGHASLSPGQSRALQAEFNWRERRL